MQQRLAVDTSFLIFMVKRKIPMERVSEALNGPVILYTSQGVINELSLISRSTRAAAGYAALALKLASRLGIKIIPSYEKPDEWLLKQPFIATVDIRLARAARARGIRVISITKSNKIAVT
ncbi:MAG: hypothetical protein QXS93_01380 [Candidatus Micrarchaeia archaeon]